MTAIRKKRKWFQFGLRTILFMPVLVGGFWFWSSWPERTAQNFHRYLAEGNVQAAQSMMPNPTQPELKSLWTVSERADAKFIAPLVPSRSWVDWLFCRGEFNLNADQQDLRMYFGSFVASRGSVRPNSEMEPAIVSAYATKNFTAKDALSKIKEDFHSDSPARIIVDPKRNMMVVLASEKTHQGLRSLLTRLEQQAVQPVPSMTDGPSSTTRRTPGSNE